MIFEICFLRNVSKKWMTTVLNEKYPSFNFIPKIIKELGLI